MCGLIWSPWLQGDLDTLEKEQEKAVRMISGPTGTTYKEMCEELGLQTREEK
jgi:hypothetical protein